MADSGLFGPYPLEEQEINDQVSGIGPGAYALGSENEKGGINIRYVGRSDNDLNKRLHDHEGEYKSFKYAFYDTAEKAYRKECWLFHTFVPPDNENHPAKPAGTNLTCNWPDCPN